MKSAVLVALLMWLCSCEKKSPEAARPYVVYNGEQKLDSLLAELRVRSTEAYLDSVLPEWRIYIKKVSYKVEYKRHVAMIDSICGDRDPCSESLGFAEYFDQKTGKTFRIEDLWHKNLIITKP